MKWKEYGRKRSWPNLRYHPEICLEKLIKNMNNLRISGFLADILNRKLPNEKKEC
jgi:hypothetical protein